MGIVLGALGCLATIADVELLKMCYKLYFVQKKVPFIHSDQCHSQRTGRVRDGGLDAGRILGGKMREGSILGAWEPNYFAVALCLVKGNCKTDIYFRPRAQQICNAMTDCTGIWLVKSSRKEPSPLSCLFERGLEIF